MLSLVVPVYRNEGSIPDLLAAVGAGLVAFAFFSLIEARWRRIRTQ